MKRGKNFHVQFVDFPWGRMVLDEHLTHTAPVQLELSKP